MAGYRALEGRSPFQAETLPATIAAILSKNLAEPRTKGEVAARAALRPHAARRPRRPRRPPSEPDSARPAQTRHATDPRAGPHRRRARRRIPRG